MSTRSEPFTPKGPTIRIVAATSAPTGVQAAVDSRRDAERIDSFEIYNSGSEDVALGYGATAAEAATNSAFPTGTGSNASKCVIVPGGALIVNRFAKGAYFSGLTATSTSNVYITPGEGL